MYGNVGLPTPYVGSVNALSPELQAVDISRTPYVGSLNALSPELQAVDISRTPYVGSLNALNPEARAGLQRAADLAAIADWARAEGLTGLSPASLNPSVASDSDAIAALPHDQLVAMFGNVG